MQESRNLWALKDETTPEELEEHVEEMNEIRGMCVEDRKSTSELQSP